MAAKVVTTASVTPKTGTVTVVSSGNSVAPRQVITAPATTYPGTAGPQLIPQLGLMVTRFPNDSARGQHAVILQQPRSGGPQTIQTIRGQAVRAPTGNVSFISSPANATLRAAPVPCLNLTPTVTSASGTTVPGQIAPHMKQITRGPTLNLSTPIQVSDLGIFLGTDAHGRQVRIQTSTIQTSKVTSLPRATHTMVSGSNVQNIVGATTQSGKVISLAGAHPGGTVRFLSPAPGIPTSGSKINIAATIAGKSVILNPAPGSVVTPVVGPVPNFAPGKSGTGVVTVNPTLMTLTSTANVSSAGATHLPVSSSASISHSMTHISSNQLIRAVSSSQPTQSQAQLQHATSEPQTLVQQSHTSSASSTAPNATVVTTLTTRPNILSSPAKSQQQVQSSLVLPPSPRPSILIRKRPTGEGSPVKPKMLHGSSSISHQPSQQLHHPQQPQHANQRLQHPSPAKMSGNQLNSHNSHDLSKISTHDTGVTPGSLVNSQKSVLKPTDTSSAPTPRKKPRKQQLEPLKMKPSPVFVTQPSRGNKQNKQQQQQQQLLLQQQQQQQHGHHQAQQNSQSKQSQHLSQQPLLTPVRSDAFYDKADHNVQHRQLNHVANSSNSIETEHIKPPPPPPPPPRRPRMNLCHPTQMPWKSLQHHFLWYQDVKPKPEKKQTLSELSNEGLQKKNGWKVHLLVSQMEEVMDTETQVKQQLMEHLRVFEDEIGPALESFNTSDNPAARYNPDAVFSKLSDLFKGNIQRSSIFLEHINDSKTLMLRLTNDHKERVGRATKKCANKRTVVK